MFITPTQRSILRQIDKIHAAAETRTQDEKARELGFFNYTTDELKTLKYLHAQYRKESPRISAN